MSREYLNIRFKEYPHIPWKVEDIFYYSFAKNFEKANIQYSIKIYNEAIIFRAPKIFDP